MNLDTIVARIKAQCPTFAAVGGAAEFDAVVAAGVPRQPAVYIVPLADDAGDNYLVGVTAQRVQVTFGVLSITSNKADASRGGAVVGSVDATRVLIRAAIHGWQPQSDAEPCLFVNGALLDFQPGVIWWQDIYRTSYDMRTTQ